MQSRRLTRALGVLALCLGVAVTSLAAAGGGAPADRAAAVVAAARAQLGEPYAWGAAGPDSWDCSGLVSTSWRVAGGVTAIPRISRDQQAWAVPIPAEQALPGDLVFFGDPVTHVGLISGRTGTTLRMIDAASSRRAVVERNVWTTGVVRFGRVPRPGMPAVLPWKPAPVVVVTTAPAPLTLPARTQRMPSTAVALAAAALARKAVGTADPGDAVFVQQVWRRAGGPLLPGTKDKLVAAGKAVPFADARVGDLVVYGPPASHVGIYVGNGLMVDASRSQGKVVLRAVWAGRALTLVRLPG